MSNRKVLVPGSNATRIEVRVAAEHRVDVPLVEATERSAAATAL